MSGDLELLEELGNAVVLQAVRDYRAALQRLRKHPTDGYASKMKYDCEEFFQSQRFDLFTRIDGKWLMEKLREEVMPDEVHTT